MAQITFTIPDEHVPRVREAWDALFEREAGESDAAFFRRTIATYVRHSVRRYEENQAASGINTDGIAL